MTDRTATLPAAPAAPADPRAPRPVRVRFGNGGSYEAAAVSRQHDPWVTRFNSADTEIFGDARTLRDKSRHLVRNNPYAANAVERLVNNFVGDGIVPRPNTGDRDKDKAIRQAFARWTEDCDAAGLLDFYGMQNLLCREWLEGGEVLIRKRLRKRKGAADVPLELQLLEADFLDPYRNGIIREGTVTIQGVEIDQGTQKRTAYWLYPQHPGNYWFNTGQALISTPVPADEILHVFEMQRTQTRGVPWGTPAIETLAMLADYETAELVRKRTEACVAGFVVNAEDELDEHIAPPGNVTDEGVDLTPMCTTYDGQLIEKFEPGLIAYLRGGKDIRFNAPNAVANYGEYKTSQLHTIASGFRIPYELISGDLSQVNFSSMRGGLVEFRRMCRRVQQHILIRFALKPIWDAWCEIAALAGVIEDADVPVIWALPKFEWVDPKADQDANRDAVRSGFRLWDDVVAEGGGDPDEQMERIRAWNQKADEYGITLDSDPRRVANTGVQQPGEYKDPDGADETPALAKPGGGKGRAVAARAARGGGPRGKLRP